MSVSLPNYAEDRPITQKHPLAIMQEAATELGRITKDKVRGSVLILNPGGANLFRYTFYLVAPTLNDYKDPLFYAWHGVQPYPISLMMSQDSQKHAKNYDAPEKFEAALTELFDGQPARQHIYNLLDAVSQAMP